MWPGFVYCQAAITYSMWVGRWATSQTASQTDASLHSCLSALTSCCIYVYVYWTAIRTGLLIAEHSKLLPNCGRHKRGRCYGMYFAVAPSQIQPIFVLNCSTSSSPHTNFAAVLPYWWTDPRTELQSWNFFQCSVWLEWSKKRLQRFFSFYQVKELWEETQSLLSSCMPSTMGKAADYLGLRSGIFLLPPSPRPLK